MNILYTLIENEFYSISIILLFGFFIYPIINPIINLISPVLYIVLYIGVEILKLLFSFILGLYLYGKLRYSSNITNYIRERKKILINNYLLENRKQVDDNKKTNIINELKNE